MKIFQIGVSAPTLFELALQGYTTTTFASEDLSELIDAIDSEQCEVLLTDVSRCPWMRASISALRKKGLHVPIIGIGTGLFGDWSSTRARFLHSGGDDLIRAPESTAEIDASIRAVIRRMRDRSSDECVLSHKTASMFVDFRRLRISVNDEPLCLTARELKVLLFLAGNLCTPCSRSAIAEYLQEHEEYPDSNSIEVLMTRLRKKLGGICVDAVGMIQTVRGIGYRLNAEQ